MLSDVWMRELQADPIVITGMGSVSAAAPTPEALWNLIREERVPAEWDPETSRTLGCSVAVYRAPAPDCWRLPLRSVRRMDRSTQFAMEAANQALEDAGWRDSVFSSHRIGVVAGTSRGAVEKWRETFHEAAGARRRVSPSLAVDTPVASLSGALSLAYGITGPCMTVSATCSSGALALMVAAEQLLLGHADLMVAGGAEAPLHIEVMAQMKSAGMLASGSEATALLRPFDRDRNGIVLGEGAAFLVLERASQAKRRGRPPHGILAGWALGADAHGRTTNHMDGARLASVMEEALHLAGRTPREVDYVNLHGTATPLNDALERTALLRLFSQPPPCSSTKPFTGHCLGATPAIEAVIGLLAIRHGHLPPTLNHHHPDPGCPLDLIPWHARKAPVHIVMSNALGFWGNLTTLVLTAPPAPKTNRPRP